MEKQKILIIDDDKNIRKTLSDILKVKGYEPLAANNGTEGLELLKQTCMDIVIIDIGLPDMSGLEVLGRVKADYPCTEAIILTGNASLASAIEATNKGAFSYLLKPYEIDQLMLHIRRALEKREAKEALSRSEMYFRSLIENSTDIITILNADGTISYISPSMIRVVGFKPSELIGRNIFEYVHPDDVPAVSDLFARAVQSPGVTLRAELRLRHGDGSWHIYEIAAQNLLKNEAVKGIVINSHDITIRKAAEDDLLEEKNQLKNILSLYQNPDARMGDIESFVIEECVRVSQSHLGFFGFINKEETVMKTNLWSEAAMEGCNVDFKPVEFSLEHAGIWAEAIRGRRPLLINDYSLPDSRKKGYPEGHVAVKRLLSIPIIREGRAVAIAAVANKEQDYTEADLVHLSLYLESAWDMFKRKQAEEQARELEKRLATIIDFLPDATFAIDVAGKIIVWNRAMEEMTGVKAENMLGKGDYEYALPFYGTRRPVLINLACEPAEESKKKYAFVRRQGNVLLAETDVTLKGMHRSLWGTAITLYDRHGDIVGAIESVRDITELKQAREELAWKTALLEAQVEATIDGIMVIDGNARRILANQNLFKLLKVPQSVRDDSDDAALLQYATTNMVKSPEKFLAKIRYLYDHPNETSMDEIELKEGMILDRYSSPVLGKNGQIYGRIWTFRDITERKKIQAELQRKNLELAGAYEELKKRQDMIVQQEKMASIGVLTAGIAHEIKNPMAIILQAVNYLQTSVTDDPLMIEVVERMNQAIIRADKIIKGLVSYSRKTPLSLTEQEIPVLIDDSLVLMEHEFRKKNLQVIKQYTPDLPRVSVDGNQIKQVFVNILLNGVDAMPPKGVFTISARQIEDGAGKKALQISFKDTGEGIPADKIKKIFDPFYTTKNIGNTGLGLSISKGIIDSHGGTIYAESEIGRGADIIIELPIPLET